jgi:hypothetical protein
MSGEDNNETTRTTTSTVSKTTTIQLWSQICQEYRQCTDPNDRVRMMRIHARSIRDEMQHASSSSSSSNRTTMDRWCRIAQTFVVFRTASDHVAELQQIAYDEWHDVLLRLATKAAFRILCNTVTQNIDTTHRLLTLVQDEPPMMMIIGSNDNNSGTTTIDHDDDDNDDDKKYRSSWNWVDLLLSASYQGGGEGRVTLAAIVACWYNANILQLQHNNNENDHDDHHDDVDRPPASSSSSSSLLLATFLRHAIPMTMQQQPEQHISPPLLPDEATDWIRRAVVLYGRLHYQPTPVRGAFTSLAAHSIVPEHVVYLLLLRQTIDECETTTTTTSPKTLEALGSTNAAIMDSLEFLAHLVTMKKSVNDDDDATSRGLRRDVCHLALEILNEALTDDDNDRATARRVAVGEVNGFVDRIVADLAVILDDWTTRSQQQQQQGSQSSRNAPLLTDDQQRFVTNAVRLIGNLTYHCPSNQDRLRSVRLSSPSSSTTDAQQQRNGLHILLSTTGLAPSCFSVREWGIVAIRNALENNATNQAVVERLRAESAVQTTALDDMGLQIAIGADGRATVTPK